MVPQGLGDTVFGAAVELVHGYNIVKPGYCCHKLGFIAPITMDMMLFFHGSWDLSPKKAMAISC